MIIKYRNTAILTNLKIILVSEDVKFMEKIANIESTLQKGIEANFQRIDTSMQKNMKVTLQKVAGMEETLQRISGIEATLKKLMSKLEEDKWSSKL